MGLVLRLLIFGLLGIFLGGISALWMGGMVAGGPRIGNSINVDGWRTDWSIGSENANPYVRARVARNGLMGLRKEEAVYFIKMTDDEGKRLREACTYRVSGGGLPANWWSITLYDGDNRLPMNTDEKLSFDQTQAEFTFEDPTEAWWFQVKASEPDDLLMPWVSSKAGGEFDLTLRLYQPSEALLADPEATLAPPKVDRIRCEEGE